MGIDGESHEEELERKMKQIDEKLERECHK